jgi:hypothetical protein
MAYCCLIASNDAHKEQEAGLESFYEGDISLQEIPKHGDPKLHMSLQKRNKKLQSKGKVLTAGQVELIYWHGSLGHCTFKQILKLADQGHIQLSATANTAKLPKCLSCIMGKAHCQAWKSNKSGKAIHRCLNNVPGSQVHIDQLKCSQPGLIPQTKGCLRKDHCNCATIFSNGSSDYSHIYLQSSTDGEQMLAMKRDFECNAKTCGRAISAYHGNNRRFIEHKFQQDLKEQRQSLSVSGIGAHHQSGKSGHYQNEQEPSSYTRMSDGQKPSHIVSGPLPCCMQTSYYITCPKTMAPLELKNLPTQIKKLKSRTNTFGCPIYVLQDPLQTAGCKIPKWNSYV